MNGHTGQICILQLTKEALREEMRKTMRELMTQLCVLRHSTFRVLAGP